MNLYSISESVQKMKAEGKRVIEFNVGDPDQRLDRRISAALTKSIDEGETHYSSAFGIPELRKGIAETYRTTPDHVFVSPGSKTAIFLAMKVLLRPGDNVVIPTPSWSAYELIARDFGADSRLLPTLHPDWRIDADGLGKSVDEKTKLVILCNPGNPTSRIIETDVLEPVAKVCADRNIIILSDECYADIAFKKVPSMRDISMERGASVITVGSFSKTFAMTGLRVGWAIADPKIVNELGKLAQHSYTNVPVPNQRAAISALGVKANLSEYMRGIYLRRANAAMEALEYSGLYVPKPDAPFYLFPKYSGNVEELAGRLIRRGVAVVPGTSFGPHPNHFRIALTVSDEALGNESPLEEGLRIISEEAAR